MSGEAIKTFLFFDVFIYLSICGCTGSLLLYVGFLQLQRAWAPLAVCGLLIAVASLVVELGLSSGAWAQLPCGVWNPLRPGIKHVSPASASTFLTSGPPGKSQSMLLDNQEGVEGLEVESDPLPNRSKPEPWNFECDFICKKGRCR